MARIIQAAWLAFAALMLLACTAAEDKAPDYRYRLTVEVDTPEGVKTGSVDLPGGRTLFALLRSDNDIEWSAHVMQGLAPKIQGEPWAKSFDNVLLINKKVEVPRMWPANATLPERSAYPMLVTFGDIADPMTIASVDPDDLAATFGKGVKLKRITAELTDDPVTTGMAERLRWLPNYYDKMLDGRTINTIEAENRLANDLSQADFSRGLTK